MPSIAQERIICFIQRRKLRKIRRRRYDVTYCVLKDLMLKSSANAKMHSVYQDTNQNCMHNLFCSHISFILWNPHLTCLYLIYYFIEDFPLNMLVNLFLLIVTFKSGINVVNNWIYFKILIRFICSSKMYILQNINEYIMVFFIPSFPIYSSTIQYSSIVGSDWFPLCNWCQETLSFFVNNLFFLELIETQPYFIKISKHSFDPSF